LILKSKKTPPATCFVHIMKHFSDLHCNKYADGSLDGNPVSETGVGSSVDFEYVYDSAGNLRFMRDPNQKGANRYVEHSYDFDGRVVLQRTCSGSLPTSLTATCSSASQSISYIYDDASVGSDEGFTINNALGRLTRVTFNGGYYLYSYNSEGHVERMYNQLSGMFGKTIHYEYNRLGEVTQVRYQPGASDSHYLWYTYDQPGRVDLIRSNTTTSQVTDAGYSYWPSGVIHNENLQSYNNTFLYDVRDRVIQINSPANDLAPFSASYTYHYNSTIDFAQFRQPDTPHPSADGRARYRHTYDKRNQIKSATYNWWDGSSWQNPTSYDVSGISYDRDGNLSGLTRRTDTGSANTYTYSYASGSNRLTSVTKNGSNTLLGYDRNGNMTSITGSYGIVSAWCDWRNLTLGYSDDDTNFTYRYDHHAGSRTGLGNRTYKKSGNVNYVRGAFGEVLAVYNSINLLYHNILRPDGTVIGRREGSNRLYYHRDHLGSTRAVVNASGTVVETQDYYPFGLQMPGRSMVSGNSAKEKFTSHELDDEVDLYYMIARRYAPEFGRFLSVDPLGGDYPGQSLYNYVINNPVNLIDPTALCPEDGSAGKNQDGPGYCLEAITVTAKRPSDGGSNFFIHNRTLVFNSSSKEGRAGLRTFLQNNSSAADQILSGNFSPAAQRIAFEERIRSGASEALQIMLKTGASLSTAISMVSGVGTVAGVGGLLLTRSALGPTVRNTLIQLTNNSSKIGLFSSGTETALNASLVPLGGANFQDVQNSFAGAAIKGLPLLKTVSGVRSTGIAGPAFRSVSNGRFVTNSFGIGRFSIVKGGVAASGLTIKLSVDNN